MKSKITLIVLIVIIIFLAALSFFFGYEYFNGKKQVEQLNETVETLTKVSEQMEENTTNDTATEVIEKVVEKGVIAKYDYNKVTNKLPNKEYNIGYQVYCNEGKLVIENNYATYNDNIRYTIDSKIVDGLESNLVIGGGVTPRICLVSENGDLYIAIPYKEGNEVSKVDELSNICRVYALGGGINQTIIAVDTDGNCYDLSQISLNI